MSSAQSAFGAMFRELIELGVVEIDTEPLNAGLEQAAHTFGIIRSLNLSGESVGITIDCIVIGAFRNST
jgi:hypothetical protein